MLSGRVLRRLGGIAFDIRWGGCLMLLLLLLRRRRRRRWRRPLLWMPWGEEGLMWMLCLSWGWMRRRKRMRRKAKLWLVW